MPPQRKTDFTVPGVCRIELLESRRLLSASIAQNHGSDASPGAQSRTIASLGIGGGLLAADQDIGSPAQAGSLAYSNGAYNVVAGGADIGRSSDKFNFAYNSWSQDGSIVARVGRMRSGRSLFPAAFGSADRFRPPI